MGWLSGSVVYFMIFWTVLFAVLPWGVRSEHIPEEEGHMGGAPVNPNLKKKFIITALLSVVIWGIIYWLIEIDVIDFYEIARQMSEEDTLK